MKDGHRHNFPRRLRALIGAAAFAALLAAGNSLKVQATESISVKSERTYRIISLVVDGANRTDVGWLTDYLDLDLPTELSDSEIIRIRAKLMTTEVFQRVDAEARLATFSGTDYVLAISLTEKWTTIPVIRGAYGGGTPLVVAGVHDTHTFGRLWTLGAEGRRYGTSPWSAVAWARAPRWLTGKHVVGLELWREFRERAIFSADGDHIGDINTNTSRVRGLVAAPLTMGARYPQTNWQAGLDVEAKREAPVQFLREEGISADTSPRGIRLETKKSTQTVLLPTLIFDNIDVSGQNMDGLRLLTKAGPMVETVGTRMRGEVELFAYKLWPSTNANLAFHSFAGSATSDSMQSQYFLGGLESIRGIPDGYVYGNRAAYFNVELRSINVNLKYLVVQEALFVDAGGAGQSWDAAGKSWRTSAGAGVRLSIPQVNRLTFRFDYAWTVDGKGGQGISAGLNQLFQPYRPL